MLTRDIALTLANNFINDLKSLGYYPNQVYMFGSMVKGNIHEYSDIDLAIWDKKLTGAMHLDYDTLKLLLVKHPNIELHPYNTADTEETNPFIEVIKKTGIQIPINDISVVNEPNEDFNKEK
jgi:predicted nucleotidyltransferase